MGDDRTAERDEKTESVEADRASRADTAMSRGDLERENAEALPDRDGTVNALSDQATHEHHPEAGDETTTRGGLDV